MVYNIYLFWLLGSTFINYLKIPPEKPPKPPLKPPPLAKPKVRRWFRRFWGSASGLGAAAGNDARIRNTTMIAAIFLKRSMMLIGLYYVQHRFQGKFRRISAKWGRGWWITGSVTVLLCYIFSSSGISGDLNGLQCTEELILFWLIYIPMHLTAKSIWDWISLGGGWI